MEYRIAQKSDIDLVMQSRLEMLKVVNELPYEYDFSEEFISTSRKYFETANQTTILSIDECVIGCATLCYMELMPTFSHPTGKRAHLMNVYTNSQYRRKGIGSKMVQMLIKEAREKGVTEISLDATDLGRPLYEKLGFVESEECMVLNLDSL